MFFLQWKQNSLVCIWFKIIKPTVRENRQEAVAFGQNQNIICDSVPCQGRVVWIVIAGNIVIGKGLRSVKPETCILKSFVLFFLQTQVLLITFSFRGVYGIYCFLPVCACAQVTALVFVKPLLKSLPLLKPLVSVVIRWSSSRVMFFSYLINYLNAREMRCHPLCRLHIFAINLTLAVMTCFLCQSRGSQTSCIISSFHETLTLIQAQYKTHIRTGMHAHTHTHAHFEKPMSKCRGEP